MMSSQWLPTATGFAKPENKNSGILKMAIVSPALGSFLGVPEIARTEAVKKIWVYIKLHNLQKVDYYRGSTAEDVNNWDAKKWDGKANKNDFHLYMCWQKN